MADARPSKLSASMTEGSSRSTTSVSSPAWAQAMPRLRPTSPPPTTTNSWVSPMDLEAAAVIRGLWAAPLTLSSASGLAWPVRVAARSARVSQSEEYKSRDWPHCGWAGLMYLNKREARGCIAMSDSPLALRMMAAKFAQLARDAADAKEAERLMGQARRYERLAVEAERALRQPRPTDPVEKAKTPSES